MDRQPKWSGRIAVRWVFAAIVLGASVTTSGQLAITPAHQSQLPLNQYIDPAELTQYTDPVTGSTAGVCALSDVASDCTRKLLDESTKYFKAIGVYDSIDSNGAGHPSADRGTFRAWKQHFGFADDGTKPGPREIRVAYFNNGDLQFGRDMHCLAHNNTTGSGPLARIVSITYACYVSNFSNDTSTDGQNLPGPVFNSAVDPRKAADVAALENHAIATVAMEVDALPGGGSSLAFTRFGDVRFLAYFADGLPFQNPALDSEGPKTIPGLCMACHGGSYVPSSSPSGPSVKKGNFLPFDTLNLVLPTPGKLVDAAGHVVDLDDQFRKLNLFVRSTNPPRQTITDLINGWYEWCGGLQKTGCRIDNVNHPFIPSGDCGARDSDPNGVKTCGWSGTPTPVPVNEANKAGFPVGTFYTEVVAKYCRTCHVALSDHFNVQNFNTWKFGQGGNAAPVAVQNRHRMPFAEVPYVLYTRNTPGPSGEGAKDFFDTFFEQGPTLRQVCLINAQPSCIADCVNTIAHCRNTTGNSPACEAQFKVCSAACFDPNSARLKSYKDRCPPF